MERRADGTAGGTPQGRKPRKKAVGKAASGVKRTLILSPETDVKLSTLSTREGLTRSQLAERFLAGSMRFVVVSYRGQDLNQTDPPSSTSAA